MLTKIPKITIKINTYTLLKVFLFSISIKTITINNIKDKINT